MTSIIQDLEKKNLIKPPPFVPTNIQYECIMGSYAYGVSEDISDCDVYSWCIPPKNYIFCDTKIHGFDQLDVFEQYAQHHINDKESRKEYDVTCYNITKYFKLIQDCNPNMIDSLFVPQHCITHITQCGQLLRENRHLFLHKGIYHRMKAYAFSQIKKAKGKNPQEGSKRKALRDKYGEDVKFLYHIVRLVGECEQVLRDCDLDLQEPSRRQHMKAVRSGDFTLDEIQKWFNEKELTLEKLYRTSSLPDRPDKEKIRGLLVDCLEMHYPQTREKVDSWKSKYNDLLGSISRIAQNG